MILAQVNVDQHIAVWNCKEISLTLFAASLFFCSHQSDRSTCTCATTALQTSRGTSSGSSLSSPSTPSTRGSACSSSPMRSTTCTLTRCGTATKVSLSGSRAEPGQLSALYSRLKPLILALTLQQGQQARFCLLTPPKYSPPTPPPPKAGIQMRRDSQRHQIAIAEWQTAFLRSSFITKVVAVFALASPRPLGIAAERKPVS